MNSYKLNINSFVYKSIKIVLWLLLIFGYSFTKINIAGPLFLYDIILIFLFSISLLKFKIPKRDLSFFWFIIVAIVYLIVSFYTGDGLVYSLRQFMIVGYFMMTYFIFENIKSNSNKLIDFILYLSKVSIYLQLGYFLIILLKGNSLFGDFNYLSPFSIMLLPVYTARVLIFDESKVKRNLKLLLVIVISTMVGHSSAFLAVVATILLFYILKSSVKQILISVSVVVAVLIALYNFLPQFRDINANWRIFYWGVGIKNTAVTYFMGNGFGKPFISDLQIQEMVDTFGNDNDLLDSDEERYIKAFHNSFITLFFHMGLFLLLIMKPFYIAIKKLIFDGNNDKVNFLVLSLLGVSVWAGFNVVLELPHSSLPFWVIFFLTSNIFISEKAIN